MKNKIRSLAATFILLLGTSIGAAPGDSLISAQGVVIATQGTEDQPKFEEPGSVATPVEIWMARIDHWPKEQKKISATKIVLIQYEFGGSEQQIELKDLNHTVWKFQLEALSAEGRKSCLAWVRTDQPFAPTLLAANAELPHAEDLPCFRMKKRPVPVRPMPTTH
jgi:hypothetical protein